MKTNYILLITLMSCQLGFAQSKNLKQAHKLFAKKAFPEAIAAYEQEEEMTEKALQNLADSYYYTDTPQKATAIYAQLFEEYEDQDDVYYLRYADAAKSIADYTTANTLLSTYSDKNIRILEDMQAIEMGVPQRFEPTVLDASSPYDDFGAAYYDRQLVFASNRNTERPVYPWTNKPFLDLYYAQVSGNVLSDEGLFPGDINTDLHESNVAFMPGGKRMYFTRTSDSYKRVGKERVAVLQIFQADLIGGKWVDIKPASISAETYSVAHPSINATGTKLYFASDMEGGFGSYDIYEVTILTDGTLGEPQNLGEHVNTDQREQFPFISDQNNLYFSSNRYTGLGGLDLYRSDWSDGAFAKAYNLGTTVNSNKDDFSLIIKENRENGFFSSNRTGKDKLYRFETYPNLGYVVQGVVKDKMSGSPLPGANVTLLSEAGSIVSQTVVGDDGTYEFDVRPNSNYQLKATRELYIPTEKDLAIKVSRVTKTNLDLVLLSYADAEENVSVNDRNDLTQVNLDKIYFDFDQATIRPDAALVLDGLVSLLQKYPEMELEVSAHTDSRGPDSYNMSLSKRRAASTLEYLVSQGIARTRLQSEGYGETQPINNCVESSCTEAEYEENRRCEFTILK